MDRLNIRNSLLFILVGLEFLTASCQNIPSNNTKGIYSDSVNVFCLKANTEFKIKTSKLIMQGGLWDNKIGTLLVPINDTIFDELNFSPSNRITSKTQKKKVNNNYVWDGKQYYFDEQGILKDVHTYKNNVLDGEYLFYHKNGIVEIKGYYKAGEEYGTWEYFDNNGRLIKKEKK